MNDKIKSWLFVVIQGVLLVGLIFLPDTNTVLPMSIKLIGKIIEYIGFAILIITFFDLRKSLTALPLPKQHGQLQVHGLYRFVRHPMYVGVLVLALGIAVSSSSLVKYAILGSLVILFNLKSRYEESLLQAKYPGYAEYMKNTPRFWPRFRKNK